MVFIPTDDNRFLKFNSPLGQDLVCTNFSGHEKLGCLFDYRLDFLSLNPDIAFNEIVGEPVCVSIELDDDEQRYFHGYITEFRYMGSRGQFVRYQATMKPWLWFLSRTADCRIFQNQKVPDIIQSVFRDNGMTDFEVELNETFRDWTYCVQYRETDLNFVSRLMEQEGIFYYFKHTESKHTLVLVDGLSAFDTFPGYETVPYYPPDAENAMRERDHIQEWMLSQAIMPGTLKLQDFDFEKPKVDLTTQHTQSRPHAYPIENHEIFDYPGEYSETDEGNEYAKRKLQELQAQHERAQASGTAKGLCSGYYFTLENFPREDQNKDYLIISVSHDIQCDAAETLSGPGAEESYSCQIEVIDLNSDYRSERITPKPIVQGPQTAIVVGPQGEEIYCDEHGRVKVQFHWDRYGDKDQNSSCWVRVSQVWAGNNWGSIHIPRVDQEVVVSFLEGDPDQPLITGRVYNAVNKPPYDLEEYKTKSGIKSRTTKEGTAENFNELRFEDKKEKEEFRMVAERDMNVGVKHVRKTAIGGILEDTNPDAGEVEADGPSGTCPPVGEVIEQTKVFADRETIIEGNDTLEVGLSADTGDGRKVTIFNGNQVTVVEKGDKSTQVMQGNINCNADTGMYKLEAAQKIELKCGGSSIVMEPAQIVIKSPQISIEGDVKVGVKAPIVTLDASGMAVVKGGLVKIN